MPSGLSPAAATIASQKGALADQVGLQERVERHQFSRAAGSAVADEVQLLARGRATGPAAADEHVDVLAAVRHHLGREGGSRTAAYSATSARAASVRRRASASASRSIESKIDLCRSPKVVALTL